jgi:hypothetical protein
MKPSTKRLKDNKPLKEPVCQCPIESCEDFGGRSISDKHPMEKMYYCKTHGIFKFVKDGENR